MKNLLTVFCLLMLALISCERPGIDNGNGDGDIDTTNIVWGDYFPSAEYQGDHEKLPRIPDYAHECFSCPVQLLKHDVQVHVLLYTSKEVHSVRHLHEGSFYCG